MIMIQDKSHGVTTFDRNDYIEKSLNILHTKQFRKPSTDQLDLGRENATCSKKN